jgi:ketosteroid isomerase-like protein
MSDENVEIVLAALDAWNRRDFDAAVGDAHEDAEIHLIGGFADLIGEEYDGREGILRFLRDMLGTIGGQVTVETTIDAGEQVVVITTVEGTGTESGVPVTLRFGQVWSFRDAKAIRLDFYYEPSEALEAVGLRE